MNTNDFAIGKRVTVIDDSSFYFFQSGTIIHADADIVRQASTRHIVVKLDGLPSGLNIRTFSDFQLHVEN